MAEKIFTPEQLSAIETRNKTLLVSAAAGSGKTATLTERIIRSLIDEKAPHDISKMLIVTFTNAAVEELRERITAALENKLAENPKNARLEAQLYMLPNAKISTIDAFCNDILKNNAERFGISPYYRIADPAEAEMLAHSIWSALITAAYNGDLSHSISPEEFEELSSCLVGVKNDSALEEVFSLLYEKSKSHEEGINIFRKFANSIKEYIKIPVEENPYGKYAMDSAKEIASHYKELYTKLLSNITYLSTTDVNYVDFFEEEKSYFSEILTQTTYEKMQEILSSERKTIPRVKKKQKLHAVFSHVRDNMKEAVQNCYDRYFFYSAEEWKNHLSDLYKLVSTLASFVAEFDKLYFEEKKRRSVLEYSDIERLAYLCLYDNDGNLTELAYAQREQYSDVYVDEYQDVNAIQNKIFAAVSKADNRFMVGDIKQSIYGFRSAKPDIFAKMKNDFPILQNSNSSNSASIFMSKNFRCDRGIIDFVNDIFHPLFTLIKESIGYVPEDRLELGKINTGTLSSIAKARTPDVYLFTNADKDEQEKLGDLSPKWVADKIKNIIKNGKLNSGKNVSPSDIAIILRKDGGRAKAYADALQKVGIQAKIPDSKSFLDNSEIQLTLCLLNAIDNPMRDIYLAGLMLSPLYEFTPDELYLIRKFGEGTSLWNSLKSYAEANEDFTKGKEFIKSLNHYRAIAEGVKVDTLIMRLYNETGLLALGAKNGGKENLMLLYNYARKFEASSFEGLFSFINYINKLISSGAGFSAPSSTEDKAAVTIITVHKSKGLEFPIVFLADASTSLYSARDKQMRVAFSEDFGIAMRTRVPNGISLVESPIYNVIMDRNAEKSLEEEMRVYYVALTRAREMLYVAGGLNVKDKATYVSDAIIRKTCVTPYSLKEAKCFIDIMFLFSTQARISWHEDETPDANIVLDDGNDIFDENYVQPSELQLPEIHELGTGNFDVDIEEKHNGSLTYEPEQIEESIPSPDSDKLYEALTERFSYKYPHVHLTTLPEKMSISKMYPTVLDGSDDTVKLSIDEQIPEDTTTVLKLPGFITGTNEHESAMRGIATHNFLQFFELDNFGEGKSQLELDRLVSKQFMTQKDAQRVRINEIELFAKSKLLSDMKQAKKLYREFRFNVMLHAPLFTGDEEKRKALEGRKILLQGVIDCLIEDDEGNLHLIDYKTDRLTKDELRDKSQAQKKLSEKHSLQLTYYSYAVEKIFSKRPKTVSIYSLPLGDTVEIKIF